MYEGELLLANIYSDLTSNKPGSPQTLGQWEKCFVSKMENDNDPKFAKKCKKVTNKLNFGLHEIYIYLSSGKNVRFRG